MRRKKHGYGYRNGIRDPNDKKGRTVRCKKHGGDVDIKMALEVQTIKGYMVSSRICEAKHGNGKRPEYYEESDAVTYVIHTSPLFHLGFKRVAKGS